MYGASIVAGGVFQGVGSTLMPHFQLGNYVGDPYTAGMAGRTPLGAARCMGSHVPGAVCPGCTLSDAAGLQALAAARRSE